MGDKHLMKNCPGGQIGDSKRISRISLTKCCWWKGEGQDKPDFHSPQWKIPQMGKPCNTAVWVLVLARLTVQSTTYINKESTKFIFGVSKPNEIRNHKGKTAFVESIQRIQMLTWFPLHVPWKLTDPPMNNLYGDYWCSWGFWH